MLRTKQDFINCLRGIITPLEKFYTKGKAGIKLSDFGVQYTDEIAKMEAFARALWGLAPLWGGGEECGEFDKICLEGIINGTDPAHEEYWGTLCADNCDQRLVETAAIGLCLVLAPHKIWDPLTEKQKDNFHNWLLQANTVFCCDNNWQFFPVLVNLGLKNVGASYNAEVVNHAISRYHSFYRSRGWYHDGNTDQADYYVPFAVHFYSLIYAKIMEKEDPENSRIFKERAKEFAKTFVYWFDESGASVAFGRSLTYRFAQCCFWSACVFAGVEPFPMGVIKGIISRHLEWWMSKPIFDNAGILTVGYAYPNLNMAEQYNAYGSPYWALKSFLILALDENHEFFKAEPLPLPDLDPVCIIPEACMTVQRINGYSVILTAGQWATWNPTHRAEKYSKFAYSSRYGFCVARSDDGIWKASPDSTLAFEVDELIFTRRKCAEHRVNPDGSIYSKWSPCRGINVESLIIPTADGHLRQHTVSCDFDCVAYDCGFATPPQEVGDTLIGSGESITTACEPNTNLINPYAKINAIKYHFKKGVTKIETKVIYPK